MDAGTKLLNELLLKAKRECLEENTYKNFDQLYSLYDKTKSQLNEYNQTDIIKERELIRRKRNLRAFKMSSLIALAMKAYLILLGSPITVPTRTMLFLMVEELSFF